MAEFDGKFWFHTMVRTYLLGSTASSILLQRFASLKCGEPQLKFLVKQVRKVGASLDVISERVKNNERAEEYKNSGNDLFSSNGDARKVAEMYTKSIAYALPGSRELAFAYANRSAVSFKAENYEDCLLDIERSLENDYPEEMRAKLYARRVRCLVTLKKPQTDIEKALTDARQALLKMDPKTNGRDLVEKTLTKKNHMAPPVSRNKNYTRLKPIVQDDSCDIRGATGITIKYSKKYGRHIVATRDIQPGEIIAVIDPYAIARSPDKCYRECAQCTKQTTVGIPCDHCINVIYCSTSCRNKAWNDYHEFECPILGILLDLDFPTNILLGIKITLKAIQEAGGIVKLKEMVKRIDSASNPRTRGFTGNVLDGTKYAAIYTLTSHSGQRGDDSYHLALVSTFTIYYLATQTKVFGQKYNTDFKIFDKNPLLYFLGGLMIKNLEIVQTNGLGIIEGKGQPDMYVGVFTALCNHSCDSNVTSLGLRKSISYAIQPIKAGEQIWDTYLGLHYSRFPKAERQQMLKTFYQFSCNCVPCIENWPMLEQLPNAIEMPGLSSTVKKLLLNTQKALLQKLETQAFLNDNMLAPKDELVQLLELVYEHACPCKEMATYRASLMYVHGMCLDPF